MTSHESFCVIYPINQLEQWRDMIEETLQMNPDIVPAGVEDGRVPPEVASAIRGARGGGKPLEGTLQEQVSARLGYDFSEVRVHTDLEADELTRQLDAIAFTIGSDVFFRLGAYEPGSVSGRRLLTHELVHVMQQRLHPVIGRGTALEVGPAWNALEREAEMIAARGSLGMRAHVAPGLDFPARVTPSPPCQIQRTAAQFVSRVRRSKVRACTDPVNHNSIHNCNEAVIWWYLRQNHTRNDTRGLIRQLVNAVSPGPPGHGIPNNGFSRLYAGAARVNRANRNDSLANLLRTIRVGDVVFVGAPNAPTHSMVVTERDQPRQRVKVRGFNSATMLWQGPYMARDRQSHNIYDNQYWLANGKFQTIAGATDFYRIPYYSYGERLRGFFSRQGIAI